MEIIFGKLISNLFGGYSSRVLFVAKIFIELKNGMIAPFKIKTVISEVIGSHSSLRKVKNLREKELAVVSFNQPLMGE